MWKLLLQVWRDLKKDLKRKLVTNKAECRATGGGIFKQLTLSPLEEAVANLLQFDKQINPEGAVLGVQCEGHSTQCELLEIVEETADSFDLDLSNVKYRCWSSLFGAKIFIWVQSTHPTPPGKSVFSKKISFASVFFISVISLWANCRFHDIQSLTQNLRH